MKCLRDSSSNSRSYFSRVRNVSSRSAVRSNRMKERTCRSPCFLTRFFSHSLRLTFPFISPTPLSASFPCCLITLMASSKYSRSCRSDSVSSGAFFRICSSSRMYRNPRNVARLWKVSNPLFEASGLLWKSCTNHPRFRGSAMTRLDDQVSERVNSPSIIR